MDQKDLEILSLLEADARMPFGAIAETVNLSKTPCWTRVQNMEKAGVIQGYRTMLDPAQLGLGLTAFVQVVVDFEHHEAFERSVNRHGSILNCFTTAGDGDYLLEVAASDVEALDLLLRGELSRLPGVQRFTTTICLKPIKRHAPLAAAAQI